MLNDRFSDDLTVADIRRLLVEKATVITLDQDHRSLLAKMIEDPRTRHVYVVDERGVLIGSVRMNTIVEYLFPLSSAIERGGAQTISSLARFGSSCFEEFMNEDPCFVEESTPLSEVARIMVREKVNELPVVDDKRHVIGEVNVYEIIAAYLKEPEGE